MRRIVFRVLPSKPDGWYIKRGSEVIQSTETKQDAIAKARRWARNEYERGGLSQLVVHGRDGKVQFEHTYGADPKRSKG